jgi:hypothetical protein
MTFRTAFLVLTLCAAAWAMSACEKPDASNKTSPSASAMLGTTTGITTYEGTEGQPPKPMAAPSGWKFELGNARYEKLEDDTPALQITLLLRSQPGAIMEAWLNGPDGATIARWRGGQTVFSEGTVCWFHRLKAGDEAVQFQPGQQTFTLAFIGKNGDVITSQTVNVNGLTPQLGGHSPAPGSSVFRDLLGCPRGS